MSLSNKSLRCAVRGLVVLTAIGSVGLSALEEARAAKRSISLTVTDVGTQTPVDTSLAAFYTIDFELPSDIEPSVLRIAVLEFYADVESFVRGDWVFLSEDSVETVGYLNDSPVLELYPLKSAFSGQLDSSQLDRRYGVTQPLVVGENRRVVLDVTSVARAYLKSPSQNYGFVIGSLTEMREGKFTLQAGSFSDGSLAKLHLYTAPRPTR